MHRALPGKPALTTPLSDKEIPSSLNNLSPGSIGLGVEWEHCSGLWLLRYLPLFSDHLIQSFLFPQSPSHPCTPDLKSGPQT